MSSTGSYACRVAATSYAGTSAQTSAPFTVVEQPPGAIVVTSRTVSPGGAVGLRVLVPGPGALNGRATFVETRTFFKRHRRGRHKVTTSRTVLYGAASASATKAGKVMLVIRPTRSASRLLAANKRLKLTLALAFIRPDGAIRRTRVTITVRP